MKLLVHDIAPSLFFTLSFSLSLISPPFVSLFLVSSLILFLEREAKGEGTGRGTATSLRRGSSRGDARRVHTCDIQAGTYASVHKVPMRSI
jgi:hypothetical protein